MKPRAYTVALVVEGPDDARTIHWLCARLSPARPMEFIGLRAGDKCTYWRNVVHEARERRIPPKHGDFGGTSGIEDARTAFLALQCFKTHDVGPSLVLLVRDSDGKAKERREGLEQAKHDYAWPFDVVIGIAHVSRECWVLTAFRPQNKKEETELVNLKKTLGFEPTEQSERLDATNETAKKNAKRVWKRLIEADGRLDAEERERQCCETVALDRLKLHGRKNGLSELIAEIELRFNKS